MPKINVAKWLPIIEQIAKMIAEKVRKGEWTMRFRKETKEQFIVLDGHLVQIKDFIEAQTELNKALAEDVEELKAEIKALKGE